MVTYEGKASSKGVINYKIIYNTTIGFWLREMYILLVRFALGTMVDTAVNGVAFGTRHVDNVGDTKWWG